jgi:lambda family phage portal protein
MDLLKFLNRPISSFFRKPQEVTKRGYGGAQINRLTADWGSASGASADSEIRGSYQLLRNRARAEVRDNPFSRNAKRQIVFSIVGGGFKFQSQVKKPDGTMDEEANGIIEKAFKRWCKAENCDVSGKMSFSKMQTVGYGSMVESGDVLYRIIRKKFNRKLGIYENVFQLEMIESDQLADDWTLVNQQNGNIIRMGVELDEWNKPIAYWIRKHHPGDYAFNYSGNYDQPERVDAKDIIHLFDIERPGQTRGVTWFYSVLMRSRDISEYEKALLTRARYEACLMGFITSPDPQISQEMPDANPPVDYLQAGTIKRLTAGDSITPYSPPSSFASAVPYLKLQYHGIATGFGISYEQFTNDFSESTYSSGRMGELQARKMYKILQEEFKEAFHLRIFEEWLEFAVLSGIVKIPRYFSGDYCCPKFFPPGFSTVDIEKEVGANAEAIATGQTTLTKVLADYGVDIDEMLKERQRELALAESLGVDITSYINKGVVKNNADQNQNLANSVSVSASTGTD